MLLRSQSILHFNVKCTILSDLRVTRTTTT